MKTVKEFGLLIVKVLSEYKLCRAESERKFNIKGGRIDDYS